MLNHSLCETGSNPMMIKSFFFFLRVTYCQISKSIQTQDVIKRPVHPGVDSDWEESAHCCPVDELFTELRSEKRADYCLQNNWTNQSITSIANYNIHNWSLNKKRYRSLQGLDSYTTIFMLHWTYSGTN